MKSFRYYGTEWEAIRSAALERDERRCRLSHHAIAGRCSQSAYLHVHHNAIPRWLANRAYQLAREGRLDELRLLLEENPELFPVLCPRHHNQADDDGREWLEEQLEYVRLRKRLGSEYHDLCDPEHVPDSSSPTQGRR